MCFHAKTVLFTEFRLNVKVFVTLLHFGCKTMNQNQQILVPYIFFASLDTQRLAQGWNNTKIHQSTIYYAGLLGR